MEEEEDVTESDVLWTYRVEVLRVLDGDTIDCRVDLGFGLSVQPGAGFLLGRFRLWGINAPELHSADHLAALAAQDALHLALPSQFSWIQSRRPDKYGRWLALVWTKLEDVGDIQKSVNADLLRRGLVRAYADEPLVLESQKT